MTYPQPSSVQAVLTGEQSFRLFTQLVSAGDMYESEVSGLAFSLGPQSDIANVRVNYVVDTLEEADGVGEIILSQDRTTVGRIDALPGEAYIKSVTRRGRILISPLDIYAPDWRPVDFDSDLWIIQPPTIDVLEYFINPPSLESQRSDKTIRYEFFDPSPALKRVFLAFPTYGRKSGFVSLLNRTAGGSPVTVGLSAVRFSLSESGGVMNGAQGVISAAAALANDATRLIPFNAATQGIWDYMFLSFADYNGGSMPIVITLSDDTY